MDGLGGALRELAREAQPVEPAAPASLWQRGRQRVRRRRTIGGVVLATVVAGLAFAGSLVPQPTVTMPAGDPHSPAIPKNVHSPNRFLAGTDDEGPLGRLAVLGQTREDRAFGISATTGEYRFLDLPGRVRDTTITLSPDGRKVAYWTSGPTRHRDFPPADGVNSVGGPVVDPVAGVAVYDSINGRVTRHLVASDYGLSVDVSEPQLLWTDDGSVLVGFGHYIGTNASNRFATYLWSLRSDQFQRVAEGERWDRVFRLPDGTLEAFSEVTDGDGATVVPLDGRLRRSGHGFGLPIGNFVDYSRKGARVVVTGWEGSGGIQRVRTGVVGPDSRVEDLTPIGEIVIAELLGWRTDHTVLVAAVRGERYADVVENADEGMGEDAGLGMAYDGDEPDWSLYEVDLVSQEVERLGTADGLGQQIGVAEDLLAAPMVPGRAPPSVLEALRVPIGVGALALAGVTALWVRARRRRAQG